MSGSMSPPTIRPLVSIGRAREQRLVYGALTGEDWRLIFLGEEEALHRIALLEALETSRTWGEFRERVHPEEYRFVIEAIREHTGLDEAQLHDTMKEHRLPRGQALVEEVGLAMGFPPRDDAQFETEAIPGYDDGGYPSFPCEDMKRWVPAGVAKLGERAAGLDYDGLEFDPEREAEIVAAFRTAGFECRRDDSTISRACGV